MKKIDPIFSFNDINGEVSHPKTEMAEQLKSCLIDPNEELKPPEKALIMVSPEGNDAILATLGNFSLLIGKAKSKKTFFVGLTVASLISKETLQTRFKGCLPPKKEKVILFDTEQGKYHVKRSLNRIVSQVKHSTTGNLYTYHLRKFSPQERLDLIEHALYNTEGLGYVVIDGIRDLVHSINDEAESMKIASKLLKWSEELNIHILVVLHQNKSDNNARGHLGSELVNKAELVLSIAPLKNNEKISIVKAAQSRDIQPDDFYFEIIDNLPSFCKGFKKENSKAKSNGNNLIEKSKIEQYRLVQECFEHTGSLGYDKLWRKMKKIHNTKYQSNLTDGKAKDFLKLCRERSWVFQKEEGGANFLKIIDHEDIE